MARKVAVLTGKGFGESGKRQRAANKAGARAAIKAKGLSSPTKTSTATQRNQRGSAGESTTPPS